jgi:GDSL-like Lipase/Acylhydrolase family
MARHNLATARATFYRSALIMSHVVLLGDSIFDNARYVPGGPAVVEQVRQALPAGWRATLLAVDGDVARGVPRQLAGLPADATHLVVSVGGNDALEASGVLGEAACTVAEALILLDGVRDRFRTDYHAMLKALAAAGRPAALCTVYDSIPGLELEARTALGLFNDVIYRAAVAARLPLIDLRFTCDRAGDYSAVSPIEPSAAGGAKIARVIAEVATGHDFGRPRCVVYV